MFALNHVRTLARAGVGAGVALLIVMIACATTHAPSRKEASPTLSGVKVESGDQGTVISLQGIAHPVFDASKQDQPPQVVVELPNVSSNNVPAVTPVHDGVVDEVEVSPTHGVHGKLGTKVLISLAAPATYETVPGGDGLQVRIQGSAAATASTAGPAAADSAMAAKPATATDPWAAPAGKSPAATSDAAKSGKSASAATDQKKATPVAEAQSGPTPTPAKQMAPMPPAKHLLAVSTTAAAKGLRVELKADGPIGQEKHFVLEHPLRLVVDLPGLKSEMKSPHMAVKSSLVKSIRVGQHPDKVRIVVDGAKGVKSFGKPQVETAPQGMLLGLGDVKLPVVKVAQAEPAASKAEAAPPAAPAPEAASASAKSTGSGAANHTDEAQSAPAAKVAQNAAAKTPKAEKAAEKGVERIHGVRLDSTATSESVTVMADGPLHYTTFQPDPETLVVRIPEAKLDEKGQSRVAPESPGPISLVSAFQQPDVAEPEVRVLIRQAKGVVPKIHQEGNELVLDFPRGSQVAEALPIDKKVQDQKDQGNNALAKTSSASAAPAATSLASTKAVAQARKAATTPPAKMEPSSGNPIDILQEGGLKSGKKYHGRHISLDFKNVDIDDVLRLIAEVSNLNIIAGDEVKGKVTIRLVDVPWDQALDVILLTKGLGFVRVGNVLRIAPAAVLKKEEEARLQERRAKEKLQDLVVKLQPVNYANVKDVQKMVKKLLSPRGSVDVDQRTNTIILKDIPSVVDEATALVKAIDTQTPQVMIEAKIVEARLDFLRALGSAWSVGVQPYTNAFDSSSAVATNRNIGGFDLAPTGSSVLGSNPNMNNIAVANPITETATGLMNLGGFLLNDRFNLDVQLQAAESNGDGKVISSPRVVTLDNRKASIEQGVSIPFQTFENGDAKLEFVDAVLRLDVTPHITADKSIIMNLKVQRNAPDDSIPTPTGSPAIDKNEAETETLVKDGQTLVIGGIYVVNQTDNTRGVPYLNRIPILGNIFKNHEVHNQRNELLVFVTPRIVVHPQTGS